MARTRLARLAAALLGSLVLAFAVPIVPSSHDEVLGMAPISRDDARGEPVSPPRLEIYKGHTLEEIASDKDLLDEVLAEADFSRPIQLKPEDAAEVQGNVADHTTDTPCANGEECP